MYKINNRILILMITLLTFQGITGAVDSEYKNSLEKVELQKTGDYSYDINLYMQKNCTSPVKVIKKSDLSYYILLPETKNASNSLTYTSKDSDIQNVKTNLFPYAGSDVNNGYTKVDINTTKPINFSLKIKNTLPNSITSASTPAIAQKKAEESAKKEEIKTNKKTSIASQPEVKQAQNTKKVQENKIKETKDKNTVVAKKELPKKIETYQRNIKTETINKLKTATKSRKSNKVAYRKTKNLQKIKKQEFPENSTKEKLEESKDEIIKQQTVIQPEEKVIEKNEETPFENDFELNKELVAQADETIAEQEFAAAAKIPQESNVKEKFDYIYDLIKTKLAGYGLGLFDVILMFVTGLIGFIVMLFLMSNRQNTGKLKRKADLLDISEKPSLTPKKEKIEKEKNDGQYFVFDKDIKQTGFIDPATDAIKKNYELSAYDPDINSNYTYNPISNDNSNESEYDIIQKILKEDAYIGLNEQQTITEEKTETSTVKDNNIEEKAINSGVTSPLTKKEEKVIIPDEPEVMSKIEIAPQKGFMCVSYNNNINLMGYIFDDVFALYNFKKSKLENYEIQCRLSEKDNANALYIVKVANQKMIVKVNSKIMKLEITL